MFQVHTLSIRLNHRGPDGPTKHPLDQIRRTSFIRLALVALMIGGFLAAPAVSLAQPVLLSPPQLDQLVARIALYPDPLLAQVLTASTYSNQICEAATWADQHSYLKGDALAHAIQDDQLPWDASVLALLPFPSVLDMMAHDPAWTEKLGNAVLTQHPEVMDAVQRMRRKARDYGYLGPNGYVNVLTDGGYIQILPINPGVIYVPYYDPYIVFAPPRPGFVVATAIHFGPAVTIGAAFGTWGWWFGSGFLWPSHAILIDHRPWERCGSEGMPTFIRMPTHGSIRLDRAWRSIIGASNSGIDVELRRKETRKSTDFRVLQQNSTSQIHSYRKPLALQRN